MRLFLNDVWAALRFEFKPLAQYAYPAWQPLSWMALIGISGGIFSDLQAGILTRALFSLVLFSAGVVAQTMWIMLWQRHIRRKPMPGSLFPLAVILNTPQLISLLLPILLPASFQLPVLLLVMLYSLVLGVLGLAEVLDEAGWRIVVALLCFAPFGFLILNIGLSWAVKMGWLVLPNLPAVGA